MKQSSIEWLIKQIEENMGDIPMNIKEQAKQMEAQQLNQACYYGYYTEELYDTRNYYKDTYGK